jgi:hypothetical protein
MVSLWCGDGSPNPCMRRALRLSARAHAARSRPPIPRGRNTQTDRAGVLASGDCMDRAETRRGGEAVPDHRTDVGPVARRRSSGGAALLGRTRWHSHMAYPLLSSSRWASCHRGSIHNHCGAAPLAHRAPLVAPCRDREDVSNRRSGGAHYACSGTRG